MNLFFKRFESNEAIRNAETKNCTSAFVYFERTECFGFVKITFDRLLVISGCESTSWVTIKILHLFTMRLIAQLVIINQSINHQSINQSSINPQSSSSSINPHKSINRSINRHQSINHHQSILISQSINHHHHQSYNHCCPNYRILMQLTLLLFTIITTEWWTGILRIETQSLEHWPSPGGLHELVDERDVLVARHPLLLDPLVRGVLPQFLRQRRQQHHQHHRQSIANFRSSR